MAVCCCCRCSALQVAVRRAVRRAGLADLARGVVVAAGSFHGRERVDVRADEVRAGVLGSSSFVVVLNESCPVVIERWMTDMKGSLERRGLP